MPQETDIKRLNDGSIDYAHYIKKSHVIRSKAAHRFISKIGSFLRGVFSTEVI
jgi:hypothetical protein